MPKLVRLYITQSLWGFAIAAVFVAGLLWLDVARLGYLATHNAMGPFAIFLLWAHMGLVFAGVQFAIAVMRLGQDDPTDKGSDDGQPYRNENRAHARTDTSTRIPRCGKRMPKHRDQKPQ